MERLIPEQRISFTRKDIAEWKAQIAALQKKVDAAELLFGSVSDAQPSAPLTTSASAEPENFMGSVVRIVTNSPEPISRQDLRDQLRAEKFSDKQISEYLTVVISKTSKAGRIKKFDNGTLWRPQ